MAKYLITSDAGVVLGEYEGADESEAIDAMARDAGYADRADMQDVTREDGRLIVEAVV